MQLLTGRRRLPGDFCPRREYGQRAPVTRAGGIYSVDRIHDTLVAPRVSAAAPVGRRRRYRQA